MSTISPLEPEHVPGPSHDPVMRLERSPSTLVEALRGHFAAAGLRLTIIPSQAPIPGSYWGPPEAGLVADQLFVRPDTPVHSVLHEGCHYLCMDPARRAQLDTDAGGSPLEECAVCYLSILLADRLPGFSAARMLLDMDAWGYTFRLGSARRWFEEDAGDARSWLQDAGWLDSAGCLRELGPRQG